MLASLPPPSPVPSISSPNFSSMTAKSPSSTSLAQPKSNTTATVKLACASCIRGHRTSTCNHKDGSKGPLYPIRAKGRPPTQCDFCRKKRMESGRHARCDCIQPGSSSAPNLKPPSAASSGAKANGVRTSVKRKRGSNGSPASQNHLVPILPQSVDRDTPKSAPTGCLTGVGNSSPEPPTSPPFDLTTRTNAGPTSPAYQWSYHPFASAPLPPITSSTPSSILPSDWTQGLTLPPPVLPVLAPPYPHEGPFRPQQRSPRTPNNEVHPDLISEPVIFSRASLSLSNLMNPCHCQTSGVCACCKSASGISSSKRRRDTVEADLSSSPKSPLSSSRADISRCCEDSSVDRPRRDQHPDISSSSPSSSSSSSSLSSTSPTVNVSYARPSCCVGPKGPQEAADPASELSAASKKSCPSSTSLSAPSIDLLLRAVDMSTEFVPPECGCTQGCRCASCAAKRVEVPSSSSSDGLALSVINDESRSDPSRPRVTEDCDTCQACDLGLNKPSGIEAVDKWIDSDRRQADDQASTSALVGSQMGRRLDEESRRRRRRTTPSIPSPPCSTYLNTTLRRETRWERRTSSSASSSLRSASSRASGTLGDDEVLHGGLMTTVVKTTTTTSSNGSRKRSSTSASACSSSSSSSSSSSNDNLEGTTDGALNGHPSSSSGNKNTNTEGHHSGTKGGGKEVRAELVLVHPSCPDCLDVVRKKGVGVLCQVEKSRKRSRPPSSSSSSSFSQSEDEEVQDEVES